MASQLSEHLKLLKMMNYLLLGIDLANGVLERELKMQNEGLLKTDYEKEISCSTVHDERIELYAHFDNLRCIFELMKD